MHLTRPRIKIASYFSLKANEETSFINLHEVETITRTYYGEVHKMKLNSKTIVRH